MGVSPRSLSPSRCDCSDYLWHAAGSGSWWSLRDRVCLHSFLTQFGMYLQLCGSILGNKSFFHIMISDGDKLVLRSHFSLEKWHYMTSSFTLLPYFCFFLLFLFGVEQLQETQTLGFWKICLLIFKSFLSKSWIHLELFGDFLCCYCAATKWNWPAAVTLFFATVPMFRICSLLSCTLGRAYNHRGPTHLQPHQLYPFRGTGHGSSERYKDESPAYHTAVVLTVNCSQHQTLW